MRRWKHFKFFAVLCLLAAGLVQGVKAAPVKSGCVLKTDRISVAYKDFRPTDVVITMPCETAA